MGSSDAGCARSCAGRRNGGGWGTLWPTVGAGPMPSSRMPGCSRFTRPGRQRDSLDEETTDWRAVCGKTARTVRRAGRGIPSRPLSTAAPALLPPLLLQLHRTAIHVGADDLGEVLDLLLEEVVGVGHHG